MKSTILCRKTALQNTWLKCIQARPGTVLLAAFSLIRLFYLSALLAWTWQIDNNRRALESLRKHFTRRLSQLSRQDQVVKLCAWQLKQTRSCKVSSKAAISQGDTNVTRGNLCKHQDTPLPHEFTRPKFEISCEMRSLRVKSHGKFLTAGFLSFWPFFSAVYLLTYRPNLKFCVVRGGPENDGWSGFERLGSGWSKRRWQSPGRGRSSESERRGEWVKNIQQKSLVLWLLVTYVFMKAYDRRPRKAAREYPAEYYTFRGYS